MSVPIRQRLLGVSMRLDSRPTRFFLVGVSGVAVSTVVFWLITRGAGLAPFWAGLAAWATSTGTNFLLNDEFTWRDRRRAGTLPRAGRMVRYYVTTLGGLLIYQAVLLVAIHRLRVFDLLANLAAIGAGGTVNYLIHNVWTWRGHRT